MSTIRLVAASLILCVSITTVALLNSSSAEATITGDYGGFEGPLGNLIGTIPQDNFDYLNGCDSTAEPWGDRSPANTGWFSDVSDRTRLPYVNEGDTSVQVRFNYITAVCKPNNDVDLHTFFLVDIDGDPEGVVSGLPPSLSPFTQELERTNVGSYDYWSVEFTYSPNGGFRSDGGSEQFTLTAQYKASNRFVDQPRVLCTPSETVIDNAADTVRNCETNTTQLDLVVFNYPAINSAVCLTNPVVLQLALGQDYSVELAYRNTGSVLQGQNINAGTASDVVNSGTFNSIDGGDDGSFERRLPLTSDGVTQVGATRTYRWSGTADKLGPQRAVVRLVEENVGWFGTGCEIRINVSNPTPPDCTLLAPPLGVEVGQPFALGFRLTRTSPDPMIVESGSFDLVGGGSVSPANHVFSGIDIPTDQTSIQITSDEFVADQPGQIQFTVNVVVVPVVGDGWSIDCGTINVRVIKQAYVRYYGGDILAGGGILGGDDECRTDAPVIGALTRHDGDAANQVFRGSGVELAAFAAGQIEGLQPTALQPISPLSLAFTNQASVDIQVNENNYQFGGGYIARCNAIDRFTQIEYDDLDTVPDTNNVFNGLESQAYRLNSGSLRARGTPLANATRAVVYADDDVYIRSDDGKFGYAEYEWANRDEIPSFTLIVQGNIYIDAGITELDGVYIAQPREDGTGGEIHTCSDGGNLINPLGTAIDEAFVYNNCDSQLRVYGAFQAKEVHLLRHVNSAYQAGEFEDRSAGGAGEVFIYPAELYLTRGAGLPRTSSPVRIQSLTALPPVF